MAGWWEPGMYRTCHDCGRATEELTPGEDQTGLYCPACLPNHEKEDEDDR